MMSLAELRDRDDTHTGDHVVWLNGVSWEDYERLLEIRGDHSAPRICYLEGTVEIMSPSREHEAIESWIGRLVEVYCAHVGIEFQTYGSWTIKEKPKERGVEPDECYVFGTERADRPHLAIVHQLHDEQYEAVDASEVVPGIDLEQLASFLDRDTTSQAMRDYRAALEAS